ncbi:Cobalamin (vitamin B12) biosynthesis CobK/CbiJ, precorrin-6x reductase, partial [gut metagenome]
MSSVIVFAGTTEGRELAAFFAENQIPVVICVATEYGEAVLENVSQLEIHRGRLDAEEMKQ